MRGAGDAVPRAAEARLTDPVAGGGKREPEPKPEPKPKPKPKSKPKSKPKKMARVG